MGAEELKIENGELKMKEPVTCDFSMAEVFRFLKELKENNNRSGLMRIKSGIWP